MTEILKDSKGVTSSVRISMFLCVGIAGYLAISGLYLGASLIELTGLCAMFLGAGIGGKVAQKGKE